MTSLLVSFLLIAAGVACYVVSGSVLVRVSAGIVLGVGIALLLLAGLSARWHGRRFIEDVFTDASVVQRQAVASPARTSVAS